MMVFGSNAYAIVGATTPFTSVEAESGSLGGGAVVRSLVTPPTTQFMSPEIEASGRAFVELKGTGQSVTWTNNTGSNCTALNLRFSIPDAPNGGGTSASLDLYVDGVFRQGIFLSSTQTWLYENASDYNSNNQSPTNGNPHLFYDETHFFISGAAVAPGSEITLQQDLTNTAAFYWLDVIDLENPPAALTQPANSLAITNATYGAVPNNPGFDSTTAIQNCINAAQSQGKSVWIPPGTYYLKTTKGLTATGITIQGAGVWYSTIYRNVPLPNATPLAAIMSMTSCTARNISLDANAPSRASVDGDGGGVDIGGSNWLMENFWIQHASSGFWASGVNGIVRNCRIDNTWGDGVNLNNVSMGGSVGINLTAYNNFVRGAGDDGVTINSVYTNGATMYTEMSNTTLSNNTTVCIWWAHGLGVYGGINDVIKDNLLCDPSKMCGMVITEFGPNGSTLDSALVQGNVIVRGGGNAYNQQQPALSVGASASRPYIANAVILSNTIINAMYSGAEMQSCSNIVFQGNTIVSPSLNGVTIASGTVGTAIIYSNTVTGLNAGKSALVNGSSIFAAIIPTNAASYNGMSGVAAETCSEGGQDVTGIENGDWTVYNSINLTGVNTFVARVASASAGGNIEVHLDSANGTLVGTCPVAATGGLQVYANTYCKITGASGTHTVYLVYTGGAGSLFNLEYFGFFNAPPVPSHQLVPGNTYSLNALVNNKYVTAPNNGASALIASNVSVGTAEQFKVIDAGGGNIGFQALVNSNYVSADNNGASPLIANRTAIGSWETFTEVDAGNGNIGLRAMNNSKYVTAPNSGASSLIAQSTSVGTAESFTVGFVDGVPPATPSGLTAASASLQATLSWVASLGATGYNVKRSTVSGGPYTAIVTNLMTTSYTNTGLTNGVTYYYVVSAQNPAGESTDTLQVSALPGSLNRIGWVATASVGSSPGNAIDGNAGTRWTTGVSQANGQWFQVDMGSANTFYQIVLDATGSSGDYPRGYQVNISSDGINWGSAVTNGSGSAAVTTISFSSPQAARYIRVTQTGSTSGWWSIHEFNVFGFSGTVPAVPTGLTAMAGDGQATLTWAAASGATGYNLKRSTTNGGPYTIIVSNLPTLIYTNTGVANGTMYYFVVSAANSTGESSNSVSASAQPVSLISPQVSFGVSGGQMQFTWPQDHTGWSLQMQTNSLAAGLGTNWVTVPNSKTTNQMTLPMDLTSGCVFFRLVYP
jgi:hypothetical protein